MSYWLFKSEPDAYAWAQLLADGVAPWDGVRNHQAANNMKAMRIGDQGFFYHSNQGRCVVGIVEVVRAYYPDPSDASGRFGMVDVKPVEALPQPVTLRQIKAEPALAEMALVRQSRLSVSPVRPEEWRTIRRLGGLPA